MPRLPLRVARLAVITVLAIVAGCGTASLPAGTPTSLEPVSSTRPQSADPSPSVSPEASLPIGFLDPSVPNWIVSARLPNACRFPIAGAIEAVVDRGIREESMTPPGTVSGSVCQYWLSREHSWYGNLHAYPPVRSADDLAAAAQDLRAVAWNVGTVGGRTYLSAYDQLLIGHDRVTLLVIVVGLGSPFEDIERLASAIFDALDASFGPPAQAGFLDPSVDNWFSTARLPHACDFPVAEAFEAVFERIDIREQEMTTPGTVAGSVCQYWYGSSMDLWFGNLHAYPPVASADDLAAAARDMRSGTLSTGTYEGRHYVAVDDSLFLADDRVTLFVIDPGLASSFEDVPRLASAIFDALDGVLTLD